MDAMQSISKFQISRLSLKIIACISMTADHICRAFFPDAIFALVIRHSIGRIAFLIFAYLLTEGFIYTKSRARYCINIGVTAILSEVIYDYLFHGTYFYSGDQNTLFELLAVLILLIIIERFDSKPAVIAISIPVFCVIVYFLNLDYGILGLLCCLFFYFLRYRPAYTAGVFACIPLVIGLGNIGSLLACIPLYFYNKKRCHIMTPLKYFFYFFYPLHLGVLLLISHLIKA